MKKKINNKLAKAFEHYQRYIQHKKPMQLIKLASKFRNELLDLETPAESIFKGYLIRMRIKFEFQRIVFAGSSFYIVDFYLPRHNVVIELDGKQHYDRIEEDIHRTFDLKKAGIYEVYRFDNSEVFDYENCSIRIKDIIHRCK